MEEIRKEGKREGGERKERREGGREEGRREGGEREERGRREDQ